MEKWILALHDFMVIKLKTSPFHISQKSAGTTFWYWRTVLRIQHPASEECPPGRRRTGPEDMWPGPSYHRSRRSSYLCWGCESCTTGRTSPWWSPRCRSPSPCPELSLSAPCRMVSTLGGQWAEMVGVRIIGRERFILVMYGIWHFWLPQIVEISYSKKTGVNVQGGI